MVFWIQNTTRKPLMEGGGTKTNMRTGPVRVGTKTNMKTRAKARTKTNTKTRAKLKRTNTKTKKTWHQ